MDERTNTTVRLRGDTGNWQATLAGAVDSSFRSGCSMKQSLGLWRGGGGRKAVRVLAGKKVGWDTQEVRKYRDGMKESQFCEWPKVFPHLEGKPA